LDMRSETTSLHLLPAPIRRCKCKDLCRKY